MSSKPSLDYMWCYAVLWRVFRPANQAKMVLPGRTEGKLGSFRTCTRCCALPDRAAHLLQVSQEYAQRLVSAHTDSCPWRDTVCDAKLGQFPKLPARDVFGDFEQRYARLDKLAQLPPLSQQAVDKIKETVRYPMHSMLQVL